MGFFQYRFQASRKTAKRMETYAGMYIIAFGIVPAVAIAQKWGMDL